MPTYREVEKATGASRFLIRTLVDELDPHADHRRKEGRVWVMDDHLAHLVSSKAVERRREREAEAATPDALHVILEAHERELETVRDAHAAELSAERTVADGLRALAADREREVERLRARISELEADNRELRSSIDRISGASPLVRALRLDRLLPRPRNPRGQEGE